MMSKATWRYIFVLVSIWLLVVVYMGWQYLSVLEDYNRKEEIAIRKEREIELISLQYEKLKKSLADTEAGKKKLEMEARELRRKNLELEHKLASLKGANSVPSSSLLPSSSLPPKSEQKDEKVEQFTGNSFTPPNKEFVIFRRRAEKTLKELWYFISSEVSKIKKFSGEEVKDKLSVMMATIEDMHHLLSINFEDLKTINGQREWLEKEHNLLSDIVQKRLHILQHPKDCNSAKKLICQLNKGCGYGCQMHHLTYCFIVAYGLERTLIIDSSGWRYSPKGWNGIFKPVSETCTTYHGSLSPWRGEDSRNDQNVLLPIVDSLFPRPKYMPLAVPRDLAEKIQQIHSHPFVWWIGQFNKYLFRYSPETQHSIERKRELLGFKKPIVG